MGTYLTDKAVKWSLERLRELPKNQTALFYFLIFARTPIVDRTSPSTRQEFEVEFYRYFGGPIKGGGVGCYDPFAAEWRAEEYLNSTVYGRLLVGSHRWTEGEEAFFSRDPKSGGWPARFSLTEEGFENLKYRSSPPCLKYDYRLPLKAVATYYFRFDDLASFAPENQEDLVDQYEKLVVATHHRLSELFVEGPSFLGSLLSPEPLSEEEKVTCYPTSPFTTESKTRVLLYREDVEYLKSRMQGGQTVADYVRALIKGGRQ